MRSALGCAALGVLLLLVAGTFDAEPLYVTGSALLLLGAGALAWIGVGGRGARLEREILARSVIEEEPLQAHAAAGHARAARPARAGPAHDHRAGHGRGARAAAAVPGRRDRGRRG